MYGMKEGSEKVFGKGYNVLPIFKDRFPYFRLYAPTEAYFDRSWPLPDIEKARQFSEDDMNKITRRDVLLGATTVVAATLIEPIPVILAPGAHRSANPSPPAAPPRPAARRARLSGQ